MQSVHFHRMKWLRPCLFPRFPLPLTYLLPSYNHQGEMRIRPHYLATRSVSFPLLSRTRENNPHRLHVPQSEEPSIAALLHPFESYGATKRKNSDIPLVRAFLFFAAGRPVGKPQASRYSPGCPLAPSDL